MSSTSRRSRQHTSTRATRPRHAVSYAEPPSSSSENENETEDEGTYQEAYRDDDFEGQLRTVRSNPRQQVPRVATRSSKRQRDYEASEDELQGPVQMKRRAVVTTRNTTSRSKKSSKIRSLRTAGWPKPLKPTKRVESIQPKQIIHSGVIPRWQELPYHILVQVFEYATYPIYDEHTFQPLPSQRWLLNASRLCRSFAEPALAALYASPPLVPMIKAHRLVNVLCADPATQAFNYRRKIKSLFIDVSQVAAYVLTGNGLLDLYGLIKHLPVLTSLEFHHQKDMPPYRDLDANIRWTYPETIFDALEYVDPTADESRGDKMNVCRLRSWRWSSRLADKAWSIDKLQMIHSRPCFDALRKISFVNYQAPFSNQKDEDPKHEIILADSLRELKNLDHLVFESSTLVNARLLPLLPNNLRHFELWNCWEVTADDLSGFLLTHGGQLRELILNHNLSLSLTFLPILGAACSHLEIFRMDLKYFNLHVSYHDSEPGYDSLMSSTQAPTWPSSLQTLELLHLRKWSTEAAELLFQSLLDNASTLLDLRSLTIQAILNIAWRDRASFRDKWVGSLNHVFKRVLHKPQNNTTVSRPLNGNHGTFVAPVDLSSTWIIEKRTTKLSKTDQFSPQSAPAGGRPTRTCATQPKDYRSMESSSSSESEGDTKPPDNTIAMSHRPRRLTLEINTLKRQIAGLDGPSNALSPANATISGGSDDDNISRRTLSRDKESETEVIQGMCDIVEVRIDNLRPAEVQVTEADFLDEEASGDDDWNGEDPDDGAYAW
ncbi:hypothetical protein BJ875DRAFT_241396 [Amylocarpus encephaloides]|uniref:Uncharacterized protein n=1 Tax=Amylocarpus encephaloides TaxID=45428 RepID=A0A9P8C6Y0_9HELO|nr:hypothetical protein BJ875DRAFT_241396 [Amylocarpus encephaloides]